MTPTFDDIQKNLTDAAIAAKSAQDQVGWSKNTDVKIATLNDSRINSAMKSVQSAIDDIEKAKNKLNKNHADAITKASEDITADFLKSSYEEASQLERYYGTTRITASVLLLTIAATIGVAMLGAIHTVDPTDNAETIARLRFGSVAIPTGIFAIMFYVNLYYEYWGNIANRIARYIEYLQILRLKDSDKFTKLVDTAGGYRAAAVRSVNRAQRSLALQMILLSTVAATLLASIPFLPRIVMTALSDNKSSKIVEAFNEVGVWYGWLPLTSILGIVLLVVLYTIVQSKKTLDERKKASRWSRTRFIEINLPSRVPEVINGTRPNWAKDRLTNSLDAWSTRHISRTDMGCVGRINVFEANFVFVFLAAALYIAVAIGVNAVPLVKSNDTQQKVEAALRALATAIERNNAKLGTLSGKLNDINNALSARAGNIDRIPASVQTPSTAQRDQTSGGQHTVQQVTLPAGPPQAQYEFARGLYLQALQEGSDFARATSALRQFVNANAQHPLAGDAQYLLGETFYTRGEWSMAAREFEAQFTTYPQHAKAPDSMLGLGQSLGRLNRHNEACRTLAELNRRYPNAQPTSGYAAQERRRLQCPE